MKQRWISHLVLIVSDAIVMVLALLLSFSLRHGTQLYFERAAPTDPTHFLTFWLFYIVLFLLLLQQGIYSKRYDFWQESEKIFRSVGMSVVIVFAFLALTKQNEGYSRFVLGTAFILIAVLLPLQKYMIKRLLFRLSYWKEGAAIIGSDPFFELHVFSNPHLGYTRTDEEHADTLFIAQSVQIEALERIMHQALLRKQEVIFIPQIKGFDFSYAHILFLFNARTNLVIIENNLFNGFNRLIKRSLDYLIILLLLPPILIVILLISLIIKVSDPAGNIFFVQKRLGENGRPFQCYKFRTMVEQSETVLETYLAQHPDEIEHYALFHKYRNDPRITPTGRWLRSSSLDELPQIFNVLKGEMSLIGPRPYMIEEESKIGPQREIVLAVKPGITGLWQVSGRSSLEFSERIGLDVWYVRNWSAWKDFIILIKTFQAVLFRRGAL